MTSEGVNPEKVAFAFAFAFAFGACSNSLMLNFDADVKKTTARHQCENSFSHLQPPRRVGCPARVLQVSEGGLHVVPVAVGAEPEEQRRSVRVEDGSDTRRAGRDGERVRELRAK